jgi:hypothetical protein
MDIDIAHDIQQTKQIEHCECGAGHGIHCRGWVPPVPEELFQVLRVVRVVAGAVSKVDGMDVLSINHDHRAYSRRRMWTGVTAMAELVHDAQADQGHDSPEGTIPFLHKYRQLFSDLR